MELAGLDPIAAGLCLIGIAVSVFGIRQNIKIRTAHVLDDSGNIVFSHPDFQRNLAVALLVLYFCAMILAGTLLSYELTGKQDKSRALAEKLLFIKSGRNTNG